MAAAIKRVAFVFALAFAFMLVVPSMALAEQADGGDDAVVEDGYFAAVEGEDAAVVEDEPEVLDGEEPAAVEEDDDMVAQAASSFTADEAIAWCKKQVGKTIEASGDAPGSLSYAQCVDFVQAYYSYLGVSKLNRDGKDYATNKNAVPSGWTRVKGGTPQKGDILVYGPSKSNEHGHVAIYESNRVTYHQNVGGNYVEKITYCAYNGFSNPYWGYIRPNFKGSVPLGKEMTSGYARTIEDGVYAIVQTSTLNAGTKYFLDIDGKESPAANGTNVAIWGTTGDPAKLASRELWRVTYSYSDKFYTIQQLGTTVSLDVKGASLNSGTNVQVYKSNGSKAQKWAISKNGAGYRLESACNGFSLDVSGGKLANGTNVQVYSDNSSAAQRWSFVPMATSQKIDISQATIAPIPDQQYTGDYVWPQPVITMNGKTLVNKVDYELMYYSNRNVGENRRIEIKGIGDYTGTTSAYYNIVEASADPEPDPDPDPDPGTDPDVTTYTVKFVDGFGNTLKTQKVAEGGEATPPDDPVHDGYEFVGWDTYDYFDVTQDLTITAEWWEADSGDPAAATYTVRFTDGQGKTLKTQKVKELDDATPPATPKRSGYKFAGWDEDYTVVVMDMTVNATWEKVSSGSEQSAPKSVTWTRLAGDNAFKTMSAVIDAGGFAKGGTVVLASLEGYWDALTAAGIAGLEKAPVVMATPDGLSPEAKSQLSKLAPKKIVVCGGTYWLPQGVLDAAKSAAGTNPQVVRLAGSNAAATAEKIAAEGKGKWSDTAIVATAGTFQDALAAAPISWAKHMPIFLAQFDSAKESGYITQATIKAMKDAGITKCYIAGGTYWIPKKVEDDLAAAKIAVVKRLGGETAVETSGLIAQEAASKLGMRAEKMGVANVAQHYDALASASFCGKANSVLVLVRDDKSSVINGFVKSSAPGMTRGYVFGGTGSVSEASMNALKAATK